MQIRLAVVVGILAVPFCARRVAAEKQEHTFQLKCRDGFVLDGKFQLPEGKTAAIADKLIILLHGSGPQSMDADLTAVTRKRKKNLFFKQLSDALSDSGFAVVRYNKRTYQLRLKLRKDALFAKSRIFRETIQNPLKFFVEDAHDCVTWAGKTFPKAGVFLLGHSQGTYVALQVARQEKNVKGVALIGFYATSTDVLVFEQIVHRPLRLFDRLDTDRNGKLNAKELAAKDHFAGSLRAQVPIIDLDGDKKLSRIEFLAGNFSNLGLADIVGVFRKQEAAYPRVADILKSAKFKVAFFQGLLDNQTPAYQTKAMELLAKRVWKKNFRFTYFPGLGHALDKRSNYNDLNFDIISPEVKKTVAKQLQAFF